MIEENWEVRTELLIGANNIEKLHNSSVLVVGLGGVGAYAAESICRAGVGKMTIVDGDQVTPGNRNRQLLALQSTEGMRKAEIMGKRLLDINPALQLTVIDDFIRDEKTQQLLSEKYDYVVDAIDTLSPKLFFIIEALKRGVKLVSSMGAGGKTNPEQVKISDIDDSFGCRLAYFIRKRLHKQGIRTGFKVVFSPEPVNRESVILISHEQNKNSTVGTISYMPAIFGCFCASVVIRDLVSE
jgi:tRNA A37 threonylcarbamoyladenosine dehydratase